VRLYQGDTSRETIYATDPVAVACQWQAQGAPLIHVVDLDGAVSGRLVHGQQIGEICAALEIPVQVGGGIRDRDALRQLFDLGASRVVLGTAALEDADFFAAACNDYPGRIVVGVDARGGKVAVAGWRRQSNVTALSLTAQTVAAGAAAVLFTDIARDGTGRGVNIEAIDEIAASTSIGVIASGGVASLADLEALVALGRQNIVGVIIGRALYDGRIALADAVALVKRAEGQR